MAVSDLLANAILIVIVAVALIVVVVFAVTTAYDGGKRR